MWYTVGNSRMLPQISEHTCGDTNVVVIKYEENFYALKNTCSHEYAPLSKGELWDDCIYCPKHGSAFNIKDGKVKGLPAVNDVKTYDTKIENGCVCVRVDP